MDKEKEVNSLEKKDQLNSVQEALESLGMGHGRINAVPVTGLSGGRGKIKELVRSPQEAKHSADNKVKSYDIIQLNTTKKTLFSDGNYDTTNDNLKSNLVRLSEPKEGRANIITNSEINAELSYDLVGENKFNFSSSCGIQRNKIGKEKYSRLAKRKKKVMNCDLLKESCLKSGDLDHDSLEKFNQVSDSSGHSACLTKRFENDFFLADNLGVPLSNNKHLNIVNSGVTKEETNHNINFSKAESPEQVISNKQSYSCLHNESMWPNSDNKVSSDRRDVRMVKTIGRGTLFSKFVASSEPLIIADSNLKNSFEISHRSDIGKKPFSSEFCKSNTQQNEESCIYAQEPNDEHEDRYFDIEEPEYLNFKQDGLDRNTETESSRIQDNCECNEKFSMEKNSNSELLESEVLVNPVLLLKETDTEHLERQILRDYSVGQMTERMKMSCGLVHGNFIANPISKLSELKLQQHIVSNLNAKNMRELFRSQMFAVPVLLERKNFILIGPPKSGKTLAYVMSVLSLLHDDGFYLELKPGNGPRCVFVSSCAQNVNYISQFCSAICGAKLPIITTHGGGLELERKEELTNGCEILVTTPRCWLRLLKHSSVTNLFRVCHIIFDDSDILLKTFLPEVQEIMSKANKMFSVRKRYCNLGIQVVFVGEKWTPVLEEITFKGLEAPVLCITAHLEAALYARIKPKTYILPPDQKLNKLKELLTFTTQIRTVIVCRCADEVKRLRPLLDPTLSDVLVAHEEMKLNLLIEVSDLWVRCTSPPILLCSDLILNELAVTNAQWLIHFSLPDNKTSFSERFSTIKEHLYDRIKYPKTVPPDCQVHILVDDSNELQFPEIINFMERLNTPIPDLLLEAVEKISVLKEEKKNENSFCENILMFGRCWKMDKCKGQHIFNQARDNSENLPINGIMKVKFLYAHNPSHYSVRILAIKNDSNEQWTEFPSNYMLIALKMSNHYSLRENRFAHGRVKIRDMVTIEVEPDLLFKRAEVIDIITRDDKFNPEQVIVLFIDEGYIDKYLASQLLHIPPELQIYPPESYDLYLIGIQPVDCDNAWSFASTLKIRRSISNLNLSESKNMFFIANVVLVAGKKLLASSFLCYEWLDHSKCHIVLFSPKKFILDTGLAEANPSHLTSLMKLALEAGIISTLPEDLRNGEDYKKEIIQWAHLDKEYPNVVHVISSVSPSLFFLKIHKFADRLESLEKELTELLNSKCRRLEVIECNNVCAAKNPEVNRWNRAIVNDVINANEVEVFFVDYGDCIVVPISEITHLPHDFIERLPFQAIECSLVGILPVDDHWLPQAIDVFDSMCFNDEHKLRSLLAKACDTTTASSTMGHHFKVILAYNEKDTYINKELVYKGYANWDREAKHYLTETIDWRDKGSEEVESEGFIDEEVFHSDVKTIGTNETVNSTSVTVRKSDDDLASCLANGEFELENSEHFVELLPPEIQFQLKKKKIDSALHQLNEMRAIEYKKDETVLSGIQMENINTENQNIELKPLSQGPPPLESCGIFHPKVYWSQTDNDIRIKVILSSISVYQVDYSDQSLVFSAFSDDRYYWFNLHLFGLIHKECVSYSSKGLYFEIKMEKLIKGEFWPRLSYDNFKFPWIKLDPDYIEQDDYTLIESMFNKGLRTENFTYDSTKRSSILGKPDLDSDVESVSSTSGSNEYHDMIHDAFDSQSD